MKRGGLTVVVFSASRTHALHAFVDSVGCTVVTTVVAVYASPNCLSSKSLLLYLSELIFLVSFSVSLDVTGQMCMTAWASYGRWLAAHIEYDTAYVRTSAID